MHVLILTTLALSVTAGASAMTLVHRDTFVARNDTPTARSSSADFTGGHATFYYQNGLPGDCGNYNSDSSLIAALRTPVSCFRDTSAQIAIADHDAGRDGALRQSLAEIPELRPFNHAHEHE